MNLARTDILMDNKNWRVVVYMPYAETSENPYTELNIMSDDMSSARIKAEHIIRAYLANSSTRKLWKDAKIVRVIHVST